MFKRPIVSLLVVFLFSLVVNAQEPNRSASLQATNPDLSKTSSRTPSDAPLYTNFRGVQLGMTADIVREKLGNLKNKSQRQDFFVFSESMTAQVFYDGGKVRAISVDYLGTGGDTPSPEDILGQPVQARPDGSIHELKWYPEAGFWVAYNRTAGENPITTVTLQKM
jgi:hypothetical protein